MAEQLMTTREVAALLSVGPSAIKRWSDSGALPCLRTAGGHRRYRRSDVDRLLHRGGPAPVDDAVRIAIAALGDAAPLWQLIRASEGPRHGAFDEAVERKRRARAYAALGESGLK